MSNYVNVGVGLKKMYIAAIGMIVCSLLTIIPLLGILFAIGILVFYVIDLQGSYIAGKDVRGCKVAFILQIVSGVINLVNSLGKRFMTISGDIEFLCDIVTEIMPVAAICLICYSVSKVHRENGMDRLAETGINTMMIYLVCYVIMFAGKQMLTVVGLSNGILIMLIVMALSIMALIKQLKFYKNSAEEFGVYI